MRANCSWAGRGGVLGPEKSICFSPFCHCPKLGPGEVAGSAPQERPGPGWVLPASLPVREPGGWISSLQKVRNELTTGGGRITGGSSASGRRSGRPLLPGEETGADRPHAAGAQDGHARCGGSSGLGPGPAASAAELPGAARGPPPSREETHVCASRRAHPNPDEQPRFQGPAPCQAPGDVNVRPSHHESSSR